MTSYIARCRRFVGFALCCLLCAASAQAQKPRLAWQFEVSNATSGYFFMGPTGGIYVALLASDTDAHDTPQTPRLMAVELTTGKVAWRSDGAFSYQHWAADEKRVYVLRAIGRSAELLAWDWASGKLLWRASAEPYYQRLVADGKRIFWVGTDRAIVAADAATGKILWRLPPSTLQISFRTPTAVVEGSLYCESVRNGGQYLSAVNTRTGAILREGKYNPTQASGYELQRLLWSPQDRLLFCQEGINGAGVNVRMIRAITAEMKIVWERRTTAAIALAHGVLVCEDGKQPPPNSIFYQTGLVGLVPATGRVLWRKTSSDDLTGVWQGYVVVRRTRRNRDPHLYSQTVIGLRPRDGKEVWSLPVGVKETHIVGRWLLVVLAGNSKRARLQAYQLDG